VGRVQKKIDIFTAQPESYAHKKYVNGKETDEYVVIREIDVTLVSTYGEIASITLTVDEAKEVVKAVQDAIKKVSKSDKQIIAAEQKRVKDLSGFFEKISTRHSVESD
jgi:alkylated DNA nucleotide flippase Atl1